MGGVDQMVGNDKNTGITAGHVGEVDLKDSREKSRHLKCEYMYLLTYRDLYFSPFHTVYL